MNEADLGEFHHGDQNLKAVLEKIDASGEQIMQQVEKPKELSEDERLMRTAVGSDSWESDYWWTRPGLWMMDELKKKLGLDT